MEKRRFPNGTRIHPFFFYVFLWWSRPSILETVTEHLFCATTGLVPAMPRCPVIFFLDLTVPCAPCEAWDPVSEAQFLLREMGQQHRAPPRAVRPHLADACLGLAHMVLRVTLGPFLSGTLTPRSPVHLFPHLCQTHGKHRPGPGARPPILVPM